MAIKKKKNNFMNTKKGFIGDIFLYVIIMFMLALALLVIAYVVTTFNDAWQGNDQITGQAKTMVSNFSDRFVDIWDFWFVLLTIGYVLVVGIFAFALRSHPVFAMLTIFIMIIIGILAVYFANSYDDVAISDDLSTVANDFLQMTWIMRRLPYFVVAMLTMFIIILYAKGRGGSAI